jgi:hypothetical protein
MSFCDYEAIVTSTRFNHMYNLPNKSSIQETKHVKAHQDSTNSDDELTTEERLNIKADSLAT